MANPPQQTAHIKFSQEELRVLNQCNKESFYNRCLPISTALGLGTYFAVKSGLLRGNPKFGAAPKVAVSVFAGYVIGKISYQKVCAEKLMALPDSKIGQLLRNRKSGIMDTPFTLGIPNEEQLIQNLPASEKYDDRPARSHMDLDFDRPTMSGLDDTYRPRIDDFPIPPPVMKDGQAPTASYDELRRKNREEYELKKTKPYRGVITPEDVPSAIRQPDDGYLRGRADPEPDLWSRPQPKDPRKPTNLYGDIFEK